MHWLVLATGGALGGALNALVGGGSFVAFPALLFAGVPPVMANATTTFALWPGGIASAWAYRRDLAATGRDEWLAFGAASLAGGAIGALLLLRTPEATFVRLVPLLLLFATLLFTFGPRLVERLRARAGAPRPSVRLTAGMALQLAISIYGGYFGGGMGIMMLAAWSLLGLLDIHAMNGLRTVLATLLNGVALLLFVLSDSVAWRPGVVVMGAATVAGYAGAAAARKLPPARARKLVLVIAWLMTAYFFVRTYAV